MPDGSAIIVRHLLTFSVFLGPIDVTANENGLQGYICGLVFGNGMLLVCDTIIRMLQVVGETSPTLPQFKLKIHYQMYETFTDAGQVASLDATHFKYHLNTTNATLT